MTKTLNTILDNLIYIVDTREQQTHILEYLESNNLKTKRLPINTGDYSIIIPGNDGVLDTSLEHLVCVERKNSISELAQCLGVYRQRFMREMERAKDIPSFHLVIEDSYYNLDHHNYKSDMTQESIKGSLFNLIAKYGVNIHFVDKYYSGEYIQKLLYYYAKNYLKNRGLK